MRLWRKSERVIILKKNFCFILTIALLVATLIPAFAESQEKTPFSFGFIEIDLPFEPVVLNEVTCVDDSSISFSLHKAVYPNPALSSIPDAEYTFSYLDVNATVMTREEMSAYLDQQVTLIPFKAAFERALSMDLDVGKTDEELALVSIGTVGKTQPYVFGERPALFCVCWHGKSLVVIGASFANLDLMDAAVEDMKSIRYVTDTIEQNARQQREAMDRKDQSEILYKINDELKVTASDLDAVRATYAYTTNENRRLAAENTELSQQDREYIYENTIMPSDDELLNKLIDEIVLLAEAKALGIVVSEEEAASYLDENMRGVQDAFANGTPEERANAKLVLDNYAAFLRGFGMTESDYRSEVQIPEAVKLLTRSAMRENYVKQSDGASGMSMEDIELSYAKYIKDLRQKYPSVE